jgi:hypothetical protein
MFARLSILKCRTLAAAGLLTFPAMTLRAELAARQPGATIGISMSNEMVYGMEQAIDWFIAKQSPDGSWGSYRLTALTLFALQSIRQPEATNACARAAAWLDRLETVPTNQPLDSYAWHLMARGPANRLSTQVRTAALAVAAKASLPDRILWREASENARPPATALNKAPGWPPAQTETMRSLWQTARKINFGFNGVLAPNGGDAVNWQQDLAQRLITSQRRDISGKGAYWAANGDATDIEQTAFALLIFLEL